MRPQAQIVVPALACVILVMLLLPLPELHVTPQPHSVKPTTKMPELTLTTAASTTSSIAENTSDGTPQRPATKLEPTLTTAENTSDGRTHACEGARIPPQALQTCAGRRLEAGYVLALKNWEQQTAGSANLMSLQCWAATLKMVVVEYFMVTSEYRIPDQLLVNTSTTSPNKFIRLRQLYDIDYWNKYSRSKCYAPLVKWEEFLCNAPREVILVHIAYSKFNRRTDLQRCPPQREYNNKFLHRYSHFFDANNFRIIRNVCLKTTKRLSTRAFNSFILGKRNSNVTVMINVWRGAMRRNVRVFMTDTKCNRNDYLPMPFARPSRKFLEHVRMYREQVLKNSNYLGVMVRLEHAILPLLHRRAWSPSQCMKGISSIWRDLKERNNLEETFWSFDVGTYGTTAFSRLASGDNEFITNDLFAYMEEHFNVSYPGVEESLSNVSRTTNEGYIATLQLNIAVRAKCLLLIGGGSFQARASATFRSLHKGSHCTVMKGLNWLKQQCLL